MKTDQKKKRKSKRIQHRVRILLQLSGGRGFIGSSDDISPKGIHLNINFPPAGVKLQERGTLHLLPNKDKYAFPCQIVRLSKHGIAVMLTAEDMTFWSLMTKNMSQQDSSVYVR